MIDVKSCCMERKKTWIENKVEAAWTSGQRHRPRSLSSHSVDSHALTVDIPWAFEADRKEDFSCESCLLSFRMFPLPSGSTAWKRLATGK